MKVLMFGSGVLGSYYGARLAADGHDVTMLARGRRLEEIKEHGLVVVDDGTGERFDLRVPITAVLDPAERYDVIIVLVRAEQVADALPTIATNAATPTILFMNNTAAGPGILNDTLGSDRVMLGFPGAAGSKDGHVVHARVVHPLIQKTTVGESGGGRSARATRIARMFKEAGFPSAVSGDMDAWLKTHAALVAPIANAFYMAGGDMLRLARTRDALVLATRAVKEGFRMLRCGGWPVTPSHLALALAAPEPIMVALLGWAARTPYAEFIIARHAAVAREEIGLLSSQLVALSRATGIAMPSFETLATYGKDGIRAAAPGSRVLPVRWGGMLAVGGAVLTALALRWMFRRS